MSDYLYEAAALLRKAAEKVEERGCRDDFNHTQVELIQGRERIAMQFARLAAIEKGLLPADLDADEVS